MQKFKKYFQFISECRLIQLSEDDVCEKHHIKPKSLGGGNEKENMIRLSLRNHRYAHWYLWQDALILYRKKNISYKAYSSISFALQCMLDMNNKNISLSTIDNTLIEKQALIREETNKIRRENMLGEKNFNYKRVFSAETRRKISEGNRGKKHTEEAKKKISKCTKGKNNPNYGKKASLETRKKQSESHKGYKFPESQKRKIGDSVRGIKSPHFKGYYCTPFGSFSGRGEIQSFLNASIIDLCARTVTKWCKDSRTDGMYSYGNKKPYPRSDFWFEPVTK